MARKASLLMALLIVLAGGWFAPKSAAALLQDRSVALGSNLPGVVTTHTFNFTVPSAATLSSMTLLYCTNSPILSDSCVAPGGLDVSAASLSTQTGNTGFSIDNSATTTNMLQITRVPASGAAVASSLVFDNITNPSTEGQTVFVRLATYATTDASGPANDTGAVAFVTADQFTVSANVPPYLRICVGVSVASNCASATDDSVDLGDLAANHANAGQTQFAAGTNSQTGYAVYAQGTTMTSGNNFIPALAAPAASAPGNGQFGINLRANSNPSVGQDPSGVGSGTVTSSYNVPNQFAFNNGDMIAASSQPTDFNRMTVSYLVNIPSQQPIGVYTTTLTYLAVAQF